MNLVALPHEMSLNIVIVSITSVFCMEQLFVQLLASKAEGLQNNCDW